MYREVVLSSTKVFNTLLHPKAIAFDYKSITIDLLIKIGHRKAQPEKGNVFVNWIFL